MILQLQYQFFFNLTYVLDSAYLNQTQPWVQHGPFWTQTWTQNQTDFLIFLIFTVSGFIKKAKRWRKSHSGPLPQLSLLLKLLNVFVMFGREDALEERLCCAHCQVPSSYLRLRTLGMQLRCKNVNKTKIALLNKFCLAFICSWNLKKICWQLIQADLLLSMHKNDTVHA